MNCDNIKIETLETVYKPAEDSYLLIEMLSEYLKDKKEKMTLLDMGSGTGIIGLCAATNKNISKVIMADINKESIMLTKRNFLANKHQIKADINIVESDLFDKLDTFIFNIITFNPPYLPNENNAELMKDAFYGGWSGIETTKRFLEKAKSHIAKDGRIFIIASSLSDIESLRRFIIASDFKIENEGKIHIFFEDIIGIELSNIDK